MNPVEEMKKFARQHADKVNHMYYDALRSGKRYISCAQQLNFEQFRFVATIEYNFTDHPNPVFPKIELEPIRTAFQDHGIDFNNLDYFEFCDLIKKEQFNALCR